MAGRKYINTAVLCFIVFFVSLVLHRPFDAIRREILPQKPSKEPIKSPTPPGSTSTRVYIPLTEEEPNRSGPHNLRPRADPSAAWDTAVASGTDLLCMMKMTKDEAAKWALKSPKWSNRFPVLSQFNDPKELKDWGWSARADGSDADGGEIKDELIDFMDSLNLYPTTFAAWALHKWIHLKDWNMNGKKGKAIPRANYNSLFSKGAVTAMVVDSMFSPQYYVSTGRANPPAPDLSRPSDVWFLLWYKHGQKYYGFPHPGSGGLISPPSHIFIQHIVTDDVRELLKKLVSKLQKPNPDGEEFDAESEEGRMLIGTKHGSAVAMFLVQHKNHFGDYVIRNARLWRTQEGDRRWNLYFNIGQVTKEEEEGAEEEQVDDPMNVDEPGSPMQVDGPGGSPMDTGPDRRVRVKI